MFSPSLHIYHHFIKKINASTIASVEPALLTPPVIAALLAGAQPHMMLRVGWVRNFRVEPNPPYNPWLSQREMDLAA